MKTGILFDLDGTLLDTLEDLADATNYALAQFGLPMRSVEQVRRVIGNGALRQITLSLPGYPDDPAPEAVLQVYKDYYRDHCNLKTRPYAGIVEALDRLQKKFPVGIVTNKPHIPAQTLCQAHFPGIYAMGETTGIPRKPNADMVRIAMETLGVDRCIYVGDSEVDISTAENAGMPCLTVLWGLRSRAELEEAGGQFFCEQPEDLETTIETILNT